MRDTGYRRRDEEAAARRRQVGPRLWTAAVALCMGLSPCRAAAAGYALGTGDRVEIQVAGEPTLSGVFEVSADGAIVYPLLGLVLVRGLSVQTACDEIRARLDKDYLVSPQVTAYVKEYRSQKVMVVGDVPAPGYYSLKADTTLLGLLQEAGVKRARGDASVVVVKPARAERDGAGASVEPGTYQFQLSRLLDGGAGGKEVTLEDGDSVLVRSTGGGKVMVSGKVRRPGVIPLTDGMTLAEAVTQAGGVAEFGNPRAVKLVRKDDVRSPVRVVDVHAILEGDRSQDVELRSDDVIVVPRRWF